MAQINPHINFNGNAEIAFNFYKSVFGGDFTKIIRFKDIASPAYPIPVQEENKLMHIALPIGDTMLMGNDVPASLGQVNEQENRSKIYVLAASGDEATQLFNGLSAGGTIEVPPSEDPEDCFFGMCRDQFGIEWIVTFEPSH